MEGKLLPIKAFSLDIYRGEIRKRWLYIIFLNHLDFIVRTCNFTHIKQNVYL